MKDLDSATSPVRVHVETPISFTSGLTIYGKMYIQNIPASMCPFLQLNDMLTLYIPFVEKLTTSVSETKRPLQSVECSNINPFPPKMSGTFYTYKVSFKSS